MYCVFPVFVIKNIKIDIISRILEKNIDKMEKIRYTYIINNREVRK